MRKAILWTGLLGVVLSFGLGCTNDKLDFGMTEDIRLSPEASVPLLKGKLTLENLITPEDSLLTIDSSDALRIRYRQDSIYTFSAQDVLELPDQAPQNLKLNQSLNFVSSDLVLSTLAGAELTSVEFFQGDLNLDLAVNTAPSVPLDLEVSINNADLNGQTFTETFTLPANQTQVSTSTDLSDMIIDLSDGGSKVNFLSFRFEILNPQDLPSGEDLDITFQLAGIEIQEAQGFFGDRVIQAPSGSFDFEVNGLENFTNGLLLTAPQFTITAHNGFGLPVEMNTNFTGVNKENEKARLLPSPFVMAASPNPGQVEESNFVIDKNSSSIVPFLEIVPHQVLYSGRAELNPNGKTFNNFINRNNELWLDFVADIPLQLRAKDMVLEETIKDVDFNIEKPDQIDSLALYFRSINRIPLGLELEVAFLESAGGDSLTGFNLSVMEAAPVNSQGQAERTVTVDSEAFISGTQVDELLRSNAVRIRAKASTGNFGNQEAQLYADDFLELQIAAKANFNLEL